VATVLLAAKAVVACAIRVKANNTVITIVLIFILIFLEVSLSPLSGTGSLPKWKNGKKE
jgi:hypothetical protein